MNRQAQQFGNSVHWKRLLNITGSQQLANVSVGRFCCSYRSAPQTSLAIQTHICMYRTSNIWFLMVGVQSLRYCFWDLLRNLLVDFYPTFSHERVLVDEHFSEFIVAVFRRGCQQQLKQQNRSCVYHHYELIKKGQNKLKHFLVLILFLMTMIMTFCIGTSCLKILEILDKLWATTKLLGTFTR